MATIETKKKAQKTLLLILYTNTITASLEIFHIFWLQLPFDFGDRIRRREEDDDGAGVGSKGKEKKEVGEALMR